MDLLVGLDIGTTRVKAVVINHQGEIIASNSLGDYETTYPRGGWAEQDPSAWWESARKVLKMTLKEEEVRTSKVQGIGLTGQMHGPVFLDKSGNSLRSCIIWSDTRAREESDLLNKRIPNLQEITGNPATSSSTAPKILWFKRRKPELFQKIWKILLPKDYINYKLTGKAVTDSSDASGTLMYDITDDSWSERIIREIGFEEAVLPQILKSTSRSGLLQEKVADELGLPGRVPVFVGGGDLATSLIGNGGIEQGMASITIGTAGQILVPLGELQEEIFDNLFLFRRSGQEGYFSLGTVPAGGLSLEWFKDSLAPGYSFEDLNGMASRSPVGSKGLFFLPFLMGTGNPHMDYLATGGFIGLTPEHGRGEMFRAIMEGVTMALRESLEISMGAGFDIKEVRLGAGATNSSTWNQIQADVYGRAVRLMKVKDPSPLGAALLAGVGKGVFRDLEEATGKAIQETKTISPEIEAQDSYNKLFEIYREIYGSLRGIFPRIKTIQQQ